LAAAPADGVGDLKDAVASGERMVDVVTLLREQVRLVDRGVCRRLNDAEHYALIFLRREFALREHVEGNDQQHDDRPESENDGPILQGSGQSSRVQSANAFEAADDATRTYAVDAGL